MMIALHPLRLGRDVIGIEHHDAAELHGLDVVLVAVLVKAEQQIRLVARAEDFAGADAHLEDGWPARDGGGNGHEGHDLLFAAAREAREEAADGLDAVLRIPGDADDRLMDAGGFRRPARRGQSYVTHVLFGAVESLILDEKKSPHSRAISEPRR